MGWGALPAGGGELTTACAAIATAPAGKPNHGMVGPVRACYPPAKVAGVLRSAHAPAHARRPLAMPTAQNPIRDESAFRWLHLTDLHAGQPGEQWLWPRVREAFLDDLGHVCELSGGTIDAVLFTGDLTFRGEEEHFVRAAQVIEDIYAAVAKAGADNPPLLCVPGNHDLVQPDAESDERAASVLRELLLWDKEDSLRKDFMQGRGLARSVVDEAFAEYDKWLESCHRVSKDRLRGALPGDFSATLRSRNGKLLLGVVGLNTAFLQLKKGNFRGKLALEAEQLHRACGGDAPAWAKGHHATLLLTHHPPWWLSERAHQVYKSEIYAGSSSWLAHLCGHLHEPLDTDTREGGGATRRLRQGAALFGMEKRGEALDDERIHGYSIGRLVLFESGQAELRFWPRRAHLTQSGEWKLRGDDRGTPSETLEVRAPAIEGGTHARDFLAPNLNSSVQAPYPDLEPYPESIVVEVVRCSKQLKFAEAAQILVKQEVPLFHGLERPALLELLSDLPEKLMVGPRTDDLRWRIVAMRDAVLVALGRNTEVTDFRRLIFPHTVTVGTKLRVLVAALEAQITRGAGFVGGDVEHLGEEVAQRISEMLAKGPYDLGAHTAALLTLARLYVRTAPPERARRMVKELRELGEKCALRRDLQAKAHLVDAESYQIAGPLSSESSRLAEPHLQMAWDLIASIETTRPHRELRADILRQWAISRRWQDDLDGARQKLLNGLQEARSAKSRAWLYHNLADVEAMRSLRNRKSPMVRWVPPRSCLTALRESRRLFPMAAGGEGICYSNLMIGGWFAESGDVWRSREYLRKAHQAATNYGLPNAQRNVEAALAASFLSVPRPPYA